MIENHREVRKAYVVRREGDFTVIELMNGAMIRLRNSRLFESREDAEKRTGEVAYQGSVRDGTGDALGCRPQKYEPA